MQPEDLELLVTREMPFGKHKGRIIADLPGNYLNWFATREGFRLERQKCDLQAVVRLELLATRSTAGLGRLATNRGSTRRDFTTSCLVPYGHSPDPDH